MTARTVFFSWQSDTRAACNRSLIESALRTALADIKNADATLECVIDRDTVGVPGAPDIGATIFSKIDAAACFVADVTIISAAGRPTPNPNVLIELGYAIKGLGWDRIILVQNGAFGPPEALPFDLRGKRTLLYNSPEDSTERASSRKQLKTAMVQALSLVLPRSIPEKPPVSLSIDFKTLQRTSDFHKYRLTVTATNITNRTFRDWHVDVEFPTALLPKNARYANAVKQLDDRVTTLLRFASNEQGIWYPGDGKLFAVEYVMDEERFRQRDTLYEMQVVARAYAEDSMVAECSQRVEDLQNY